MRQCARLKAERAVFLTLTYLGDQRPGCQAAKADLRAFKEKIRRRFPFASAVWRMEMQQRGVPHFHLILYNLPFVPKKLLAKWWADIIGYDDQDRPPFTRIEFCKSAKQVSLYIAKYVAKVDDSEATDQEEVDVDPETGEVASGFNLSAYLHAGRWWGVHNRAWLPLAKRVQITVWDEHSRLLYDYKRAMKRLVGWWQPGGYRGQVNFADADMAQRVIWSLVRAGDYPIRCVTVRTTPENRRVMAMTPFFLVEVIRWIHRDDSEVSPEKRQSWLEHRYRDVSLYRASTRASTYATRVAALRW